MIIKSLSILNFRNFNSVGIKFNERLNLIIGDNGQGKTNIIEAIYLLTEGESFRYAKTENLITLGKNKASICSTVVNENLDYKILLTLMNNNKNLFINDKAASINKMSKFSIVLFSPESLNIIKDSSDARRHAVDQLVEQTTINGINIIRDFKKILKTRNRLLKDISEEKINIKIGIDTLEGINTLYLKIAAELTIMRINVLNEIKPEVEISLNKINGSNFTKFDFDYLISEKNHKTADFETVLEALRNRMKELAHLELKSGISLVGPQKHDVIFLYNGNNSRFYCSQGQQRSIILAYKMAQIVYHQKIHGFYPLLLLDDVLSELDLLKQESLISTLNQTETQTFVTTTDVSLLSKLSMNKASVFKIQNGQVIV